MLIPTSVKLHPLDRTAHRRHLILGPLARLGNHGHRIDQLCGPVCWVTANPDIVEPTARTVDELKKLNLPAGVDITIKI